MKVSTFGNFWTCLKLPIPGPETYLSQDTELEFDLLEISPNKIFIIIHMEQYTQLGICKTAMSSFSLTKYSSYSEVIFMTGPENEPIASGKLIFCYIL